MIALSIRDISEAGWKIFKKVRQVMIERHCQATLQRVMEAAQVRDERYHEGYFEVQDIMARRKREMADAFDDCRRSTAILQLLIMRRLGLLADSDLSGFSENVRSRLLQGMSLLGGENDA